MLKISQPYVRETPVRDEKEGRAIVVKLDPPGYSIGFRLRGGRTTWYIPVKDAYMAARYTINHVPQGQIAHVKTPPIKQEILRVLEAKGQLNIAQVMKEMKEKGMSLRRNEAGTILELMKDAGLVKQDGFSYQLVKGGKS